MEEVTIQQLMEKAKQLEKQRKKWHFHMLTPNCVFNKHKDKHAFILENETDKENFVVYSSERYMKKGQTLVKMIHGKDIIKEKSGEVGKDNEKINKYVI